MDDTIESDSYCSHVNRNDPRCSHRFSLGRIEQAFTVCFGSFQGCPMYHRINAETMAGQTESEGTLQPRVTLTANGAALPLQRTGT